MQVSAPATSAAVVTSAQPLLRALERRNFGEQARIHADRLQQPQSTSLAALKNNPKRDKGPSNENLTSLKQALAAVLVSKNNESIGHAVTRNADTTRMAPAFESRPQGAIVQQSFLEEVQQVASVQSQPIGVPAVVSTQAETPLTPMPPPSRQELPPLLQQAATFPRPALLESPFEEASPREIPEDVLKSVLAD